MAENKQVESSNQWNADSIATLMNAGGNLISGVITAKQGGSVAASQAAQAASSAQLAAAQAEAAEASRKTTYIIAGSVAAVLALVAILALRKK